MLEFIRAASKSTDSSVGIVEWGICTPGWAGDASRVPGLARGLGESDVGETPQIRPQAAFDGANRLFYYQDGICFGSLYPFTESPGGMTFTLVVSYP
jgi:hypothetical protein